MRLSSLRCLPALSSRDYLIVGDTQTQNLGASRHLESADYFPLLQCEVLENLYVFARRQQLTHIDYWPLPLRRFA